jgi:two-component system phosphate regulon response regulator OmpR
LEVDGYKVESCGPEHPSATIQTKRPRLILMDARERGEQSDQLRRALWRRRRPLLLVTSYDDEHPEADTFKGAASDFILAPFRPSELRYRIGRLARGVAPEAPYVRRRAGQLEIDVEARTVRRGNEIVALMPSELRILLLMASAPDRVWSPHRLADGAGLHVEADNVEPAVRTHMRRLRAKLEIDPKSPRYLQTVRGAGYKLDLGPSL